MNKLTNTQYTINTNLITIIACVLGFVVLLTCVRSCDSTPPTIIIDTVDVRKYTTKIKEQDSLIQTYQNNIDTLIAKQYQLSEKLIQTRKEYEIKIKNIKRYTPTQLDSFFTNRYKKY
jgi:hypothetical protein